MLAIDTRRTNRLADPGDLVFPLVPGRRDGRGERPCRLRRTSRQITANYHVHAAPGQSPRLRGTKARICPKSRPGSLALKSLRWGPSETTLRIDVGYYAARALLRKIYQRHRGSPGGGARCRLCFGTRGQKHGQQRSCRVLALLCPTRWRRARCRYSAPWAEPPSMSSSWITIKRIAQAHFALRRLDGVPTASPMFVDAMPNWPRGRRPRPLEIFGVAPVKHPLTGYGRGGAVACERHSRNEGCAPDLRRMRLLATALLALMSAIFVLRFGTLLKFEWTWLAYLRAFAEAGMISGPAPTGSPLSPCSGNRSACLYRIRRSCRTTRSELAAPSVASCPTTSCRRRS